MKVGLITFHAVHHYGAQLQAYALMRAVGQCGCECDVIDYRLPGDAAKNRVLERGVSVRGMMKNAHSLLHYSALKRRYQRFELFLREHIRRSPQSYGSYAELCAGSLGYDRYVCGSDQIWNPAMFEDKRLDPAFFLGFSGDAPRIAYAPSFGAAQFTPETRAELLGYLNGFARLSSRERRGAGMIADLTGRDAPVTLDPTLLWAEKDWGALAHGKESGAPYILCYFLSPPDKLGPLVSEAKRRTGAQVLQLGTRRRADGVDKVILDAGPLEFLALFQKAAFVVTNSFHGTVFALQFRRPFICGASSAEGKDPAASRMGQLLDSLGLLDRLYTGGPTERLDKPIDYEAANARLQPLREQSWEYLRTSLQEPEETL